MIGECVKKGIYIYIYIDIDLFDSNESIIYGIIQLLLKIKDFKSLEAREDIMNHIFLFINLYFFNKR